VKFAKHPDFSVRGSALYYDLELAPWEAVLGAKISMPTLEGSISLKIPPGTRNGQQLRLRGKGLPGKEKVRGDLYAVISIQVPVEPSADEKLLWQDLASKSTFNPRSSS
jgi:curved DNA-binding protein